MSNSLDEEDFDIGDMTLGALVDLRDQLINPVNPKTSYSNDLLENVDLALNKYLQVKIINNKDYE